MANTCKCPNPPGSTVICESDQLAICFVKNGEAVHRCIDIVRTHDSRTLLNTVFRAVTKGARPLFAGYRIKEKVEILERGEFEGRRHILIRFALPQDIRERLGLNQQRDNNNDYEVRA